MSKLKNLNQNQTEVMQKSANPKLKITITSTCSSNITLIKNIKNFNNVARNEIKIDIKSYIIGFGLSLAILATTLLVGNFSYWI
jgi:hypothetical protein